MAELQEPLELLAPWELLPGLLRLWVLQGTHMARHAALSWEVLRSCFCPEPALRASRQSLQAWSLL